VLAVAVQYPLSSLCQGGQGDLSQQIRWANLVSYDLEAKQRAKPGPPRGNRLHSFTISLRRRPKLALGRIKSLSVVQAIQRKRSSGTRLWRRVGEVFEKNEASHRLW
jgi:hypothetical protein